MWRPSEEINAEVERLKAMKETVRHLSLFGDDNWKAIEGQIHVLDRRVEEEDIFASDEPVYEAMLDAYCWGTGGPEGDCPPPSSEWAELVVA